MATVTDKAFFTWNSWDFWERPNGHLFCEECATEVWCIHIQKMVADNGDSEVIFAQYEPSVFVAIEVPMFPTFNLWQRATLYGHDKIPAFYVGIGEDNAEKAKLGFLNIGEGRNVLRSMVLDWFRGNVVTDMLECKSSAHSFSAQVAWEKVMMAGTIGERVANYFAVWQQKSCLHCLTNGNVTDPDLIPDIGTAPNNPWR